MDRLKRDKYIEIIIGCIVYLSVLIFILYPFYKVFEEAFTKGGSLNLSGFLHFFGKDIKLLKNSLMTGGLTVIFSTIASLAIAVYVYLKGEKTERIVLIFLLMTMISPPFVTSLSYIQMFGKRGFITHDILGLTLNTYGMWGIVAMQTLGFISFNTIILLGGIKKIDPKILYSARDLGANTDKLIVSIILPLIKKTTVITMLLTFVRSLADFSTPAIIGGSFSTIATEAYLNMIAYGNLNYASVINVILFIPSFIAFLFYRKGMKDGSKSQGQSSESLDFKLNGILYRTIQVISIFLIVWIGIQYASIVFSAFTKKYQGVPYFTLSHFIDSKSYLKQTLLRSLIYSAISGGLGALLGLLIGYFLSIRKLKTMKYIDFIAMMPYIIPGSFFGIGYILAFKNPPLQLTGTAAIVVLNMLFKQLPFSSKIGVETAESIREEEIGAIRDLGGSGLNIFKDSVFPNARYNLAMAFANGFSASMTTIGSIIFIIYPSQKVLTVVMFDAIQSSKYGVGSALACTIIAITASVNFAIFLLLKRRA